MYYHRDMNGLNTSSNRVMMIMSISLIIVLLVGFLTCPSAKDFDHFITDQVKERISNEVKSSFWQKAVQGIASLAYETESNNYYLFTLNKVELVTGNQREFVGIAGYFIPLGDWSDGMIKIETK
ncbi:MAG: hypothetical protein JXQ90_05125 [Cyclobacteriaceae bacterium]